MRDNSLPQRDMKRRSAIFRVLRLILIAYVPGAPLVGQGTASISGQVVQAATDEPVSGASLTLRRIPGDSFPVRTTATDLQGRYMFSDLQPGTYELDVVRLGFRSAQISIDIRAAAVSRMSVSLQMTPIALEEMTVTGRQEGLYGREQSRAGAFSAVELTQATYLSSDVTSLTHTEMLGAITLGEPDLFRALQRLPGVSTRDDWTAELWTRGSDWDHTRVYVDGLPHFNPVHAAGVFSPG